MAILDTRKEKSLPSTPRRMRAELFASSKTKSSLSSFSGHSPPATPPHTFSEAMMEENIDNAEVLIKKWDPNGSSYGKLFQENRKEAKEFVRCVKELRRAMHFLVSQHSSSGKLVKAQNLMHMAMARLEKEFYQILSANRQYLDPESVSSRSSHLSQSLSTDSEQEDGGCSDNEIQEAGESISKVERLSVLAMSDLRLIADCMVSSGYAKECVNIYKIIRKSIVDEGLYHLGIQQYSSSHISKMSSNVLEDQIKNWLNAVKIAVKTLFHGERFLCDHVFSASQTMREACFTVIAKEGATNLFRFPELVAKSKGSPEKMFRLMDLYEGISELWPEIESIFSYESVSAVRLQALSSLHKLCSSVQTLLSEFESSIHKNSSRTPILGGGIHPLTISVMDFVSSLGDYSDVLYDIIGDSAGSPARTPFPESYFESPPSASETPTSAVSARLAWIILVLLCKLDSKAELYNDIALSYLFLANNLQYVVEKVRSSFLKCLLGDNWVSKLDRKVKSYAANYKAMAWAKVFSCLPEILDPSLSPDSIKEHFRQFSAAFEEAYRKQTAYVVPDGKLRDEIKLSVAKLLVPMYREFYDTYLEVLSSEKNLEVMVRYSPDNLGNYLSDLFHGASMSRSSSSSSLSSNSRVPRCLN
ncbi:exocyst complex component EXO70H1 [Ipomoea triloba]|uniref:exocyst complex component EXO70H1 n=1 Tax=Ipomoea triloba TaxID=35885 RepID=UPI00125E82C2|nr:exocyst complex component EXO70H1 [Ipomoea triloba]